MADEDRGGPSIEDILVNVEAAMADARAATTGDPASTLTAHTYTIDGLDALPEPAWLVEDVIPERGLGVIWGESGSYKTFLALHLALSIAAGIHVLERRTTPSTVLYVAGEGGHGIRKRIAAWRQAHPDADPAPYFRVLVYPPPLGSPDQVWAQALAELARDLNMSLVILDTVARTFGPGDENSTQDMGAYVAACDRIARAIDGAVGLVHHSGTDKSRMRGNTSLYAAADWVLGVTRQSTGWAQMSNAWAVKGKAKDAEEMAEPATFRLDKVGDSLVPIQVPAADMPGLIAGDAKPREPKSLSSDRMARINTVVAAIAGAGGALSSTKAVLAATGWRSWEKAEKALAEASQIGAIECRPGPHGAKVWTLREGWDQ